jgi:3',5'-cyclic-AMP phosphodiesterase
LTTIAHLSDPHLDTSAERLDRLHRVMAQVRELDDIAAVLVSGDIADHGEPEEYREFFSAMAGDLATIVVPGNHDVSAVMSEALCAVDGNASLNRVLQVGELTLVGLDSHIDHADEGELDPVALDFARSAIRTAPGWVVLAMHHPPVPVGHQVMDRFGLQNPKDLEVLVRESDTVVAVLSGHVHTALATTFAGRPLLGAPGIVSTMRLGSKTDPVADSAAVPGLALHTIHGDVVRTVFHYLSPNAR